ncbi:MAG TPA: PAS domain S-box protein [Bacteroidales bacterium]|nr:PAS domain S-box protein [Bacteroidales bacterium]
MENDILISLFQNAAILISLVVIFDLLTHHHIISNKFVVKIIGGFFVGLLGIALMITGNELEPGHIIDTRSVLLSVTGLFLGLIPTIIAMVITILFRILEGGASTWIGITIIFVSGSFGLFARLFWRKKLDKLSHIQIYLFGLVCHILMSIAILIYTKEVSTYLFINLTLPTLIIFPIVSSALCFLLQHRIRRDIVAKKVDNDNKRLNLALKAADLLFFDKDLKTQTISFSDSENILLKEIRQKNKGKFEDFFEYIHPDDVPAFTRKMEYAKLNKESIQTEFRVITTYGMICWIHFVCQFFFDQDDNPIRIIGVIKDISSEKRTETSLSESEFRFRTILENAPDGIFVNTQGVFTFINPKMLDLLNAKDESELIGTDIFERIAPEFHEIVKSRINIQKETGQNAKLMEQEYIRIDGSRIVVTTSAAPIKYRGKESNLVFVHDLSSRKQTEEKIIKLSRAVEQSPVSIVIADISGTIEYVNPKFSEVTGYSYDELIGKNPNVLKSGFTTSLEYEQLWNTIMSGNVWVGEFKNIKKDGTTYWEAATIAPIKNLKGEITHYVGVKEDITEKKEIYAALIEAKNKAEETNLLKSHFLANMSHEIRTPLGGILGFLELLKDKSVSENERNDFIEIISKSGQRLLETINDIIEMSRIEAGFVKIDVEEVNLFHVIQDLFHFFKPQVDAKGLDFKLYVPQNQSDHLINFFTDKNKLNGILTNLIKNSIKFTEKGSIDLLLIEKSNGIQISIKDSGKGIPKDKMEAIFERFIQADMKNSQNQEGSGLGLSISKAYIEQLEGKIWVESEVNMGTTFFIFLPYIHSNSQNDISSTIEQNQTLPSDVIYNILIAEDEDNNFQYLNVLMKKLGFQIIRAVNGLDAVNMVKESKHLDLILMDIKMPEMTGIEAMKEIRKFNKTIPIIAQSAFFMNGNEDLLNENGFTDYIMKPIKKDQLEILIKKYLKIIPIDRVKFHESSS